MNPVASASHTEARTASPPAIRGHHAGVAGEQLARFALVTVRGDPVDREGVGEGAPQRAALSLQPPAGLVHVERPAAPHPPREILVGPLERVAGTGQDRVDRASAQARTEQLLAQLDGVPPRDTIANRERRDGGPQPRTERAAADPGRQLAGPFVPARRAAHAHALMLDHPDRQPRQLLDLITPRRADRDPLGLGEDVPAATDRGPVTDDLVDRGRRQQLTAATLMTRLTAWRAPRPLRPPRWTRTRRIARWRPRGVARVAGKLPLELVDPRRQPLNLPPQPLVLRRKLKQNTHNRLTARVVDRLRLTPIHTPRFDAAELCPPDQLNAYRIEAEACVAVDRASALACWRGVGLGWRRVCRSRRR